MKKIVLLLILSLVLGCAYETQPEAWRIELKPEQTPDAISKPDGYGQPGDLRNRRCKVLKVIDGDTIDVRKSAKETMRVRLNGIDTPEIGQPFGKNAKQYLSDAIDGEVIDLEPHAIDSHGRIHADVYFRPRDPFIRRPRRFINPELVQRGLAWHYKQCSDDQKLAQYEKRARAAKFGLWNDPRHVAPWHWRKLSKEERDELR